MTTNITDVDEFTDPIVAPDDGDAANGTAFQLSPQGLANRTRWIINRLLNGAEGGSKTPSAPIEILGDGGGTGYGLSVEELRVVNSLLLQGKTITPPTAARYQVIGTDIALAGLFPLIESFKEGNYTLASDEVQVPEAGIYLINVALHLSSESTANPTGCNVELQIGSSTVATARGTRFSATTTDIVSANTSYLGSIATPATEKIRLRAAGVGDLSINGAQRWLNIVKIGA